MRAHQIHVDPGPRHYYESHDRDTPLCTADPLITFHLSGPVSAIYARQASLTLLATDERTIDRFLTYAYSCAYGLCERMQLDAHHRSHQLLSNEDTERAT